MRLRRSPPAVARVPRREGKSVRYRTYYFDKLPEPKLGRPRRGTGTQGRPPDTWSDPPGPRAGADAVGRFRIGRRALGALSRAAATELRLRQFVEVVGPVADRLPLPRRGLERLLKAIGAAALRATVASVTYSRFSCR